jgi:hypothetical protein
MNNNHIIQCKKVILNNKKYKGYVQLSLADKLYLRSLTKKLKKEGNINNISFEEFVLLCKYHKKTAILRLESNYSTSFIDILKFDHNTLYLSIQKVLDEIKLHHDENKYNNIESIINLMAVSNVILFDYFTDICNDLEIKICIE